MTKFEQIGVNYQYEAADKASANRSFAYSCKCCCQHGMRIECDRCAIEIAHSMVIAAFDSMEQGVNAQ